MSEEEFEDIFGNVPFENIKKIQKYIADNYVSLDLYNKEKQKNKELLEERKSYAEEYIHNNPWLYKQLNELYVFKTDVEKSYISKDKIREKIKYKEDLILQIENYTLLKNQTEKEKNELQILETEIKAYKNLLEEE